MAFCFRARCCCDCSVNVSIEYRGKMESRAGRRAGYDATARFVIARRKRVECLTASRVRAKLVALSVKSPAPLCKALREISRHQSWVIGDNECAIERAPLARLKMA